MDHSLFKLTHYLEGSWPIELLSIIIIQNDTRPFTCIIMHENDLHAKPVAKVNITLDDMTQLQYKYWNYKSQD